MINNAKYNLRIGWLYPKLMSTYGDRGNIIVLAKRCEWRGIGAQVINLDEGFSVKLLNDVDVLFMGGAQDLQQKIVSDDFSKDKIKLLKEKVENGTPGLYVCGAYQFLGKYYKEANGNIIKGLGILDLYTLSPGDSKKRLIGDIAFKSSINFKRQESIIIGFENHGGRTYLGKNIKPFGTLIKGFGNNGNQPATEGGKALQAGDKTEGAIYKNSIGTYLHGPILPKNPQIADFLIEKALEIKYGEKIKLEKLDDSLSQKARKSVLKKLFLFKFNHCENY